MPSSGRNMFPLHVAFSCCVQIFDLEALCSQWGAGPYPSLPSRLPPSPTRRELLWLACWSRDRYYTKEGGQLKGAIPLPGLGVRISTAGTAHDHELELLAPDRTYRIRGASDDERLAWLNALREATGSTVEGAAPRTVSVIWEEKDIGAQRESHRDPEGERRIHALGQQHAAAGTIFTDSEFPPNDTSLFGACGREEHTQVPGTDGRRDQKPFLQDKTVVWKAPHEILDPSARAVVFSGGIDADDICQGELGNCYFLAAMAACAAYQNLIEDLVVEGAFICMNDQSTPLMFHLFRLQRIWSKG